MRKQVISIGVQDFGKLRERKAFYVDKTDFIKEWWENQDDVTLITRPRRFDKTLTMSTMEHFFPISMPGRENCLKGFLIVDLRDQCRITSNRESGFGRYDVILEPYDKNEMAIVMEFKVFNPLREKDLNDTALWAGISGEKGADRCVVACRLNGR